ncbi:hypothetical protein BDR26DRAFT_914827 [Obelidium mucronatum]|nr:hypothetical protein BDR26DRAFT_914827 [Obelidium mucronatum]
MRPTSDSSKTVSFSGSRRSVPVAQHPFTIFPYEVWVLILKYLRLNDCFALKNLCSAFEAVHADLLAVMRSCEPISSLRAFAWQSEAKADDLLIHRHVDAFVRGGLGPEPERYTDVFAEWEHYDSTLQGLELFELRDTWLRKAGGAKGRSHSRDHAEWEGAYLRMLKELKRDLSKVWAMHGKLFPFTKAENAAWKEAKAIRTGTGTGSRAGTRKGSSSSSVSVPVVEAFDSDSDAADACASRKTKSRRRATSRASSRHSHSDAAADAKPPPSPSPGGHGRRRAKPCATQAGVTQAGVTQAGVTQPCVTPALSASHPTPALLLSPSPVLGASPCLLSTSSPQPRSILRKSFFNMSEIANLAPPFSLDAADEDPLHHNDKTQKTVPLSTTSSHQPQRQMSDSSPFFEMDVEWKSPMLNPSPCMANPRVDSTSSCLSFSSTTVGTETPPPLSRRQLRLLKKQSLGGLDVHPNAFLQSSPSGFGKPVTVVTTDDILSPTFTLFEELKLN